MDAELPHFHRIALASLWICLILIRLCPSAAFAVPSSVSGNQPTPSVASNTTGGWLGGKEDVEAGVDLDKNVTDTDSLEAFKAGISVDPNNVLGRWSAATPGGVCSWEGIGCNSKNRVASVKLAGQGLGGQINILPGGFPFLSNFNLSNNSLNGSIPVELSQRKLLRALDLSFNNLTGAIHFDFGYLANLERLWLQRNHLTGSIPSSLALLSNLKSLDLSGNSLTGSIPLSIGNLSMLSYLNLRRNGLSGAIPHSLSNCSSLKALDLGYNNLSGELPPALPPSLLRLDLISNKLSGSIPVEGINGTRSLEVLLLSWNQFTGNIPGTLGFAENLTVLDLQRNQLVGPIPAELQQLSKLCVLSLANNQLRGALAPWLRKLTSLQVLLLSNNRIGGQIPVELGNMTRLQSPVWKLNTTTLYQEHQIGRPVFSYVLGRAAVLDLSFDLVWGSIPVGLGDLVGLSYLNLSLNMLSGNIPSSLGNLSNVDIMDLSTNNLEGTIPERLTSLKYFSVSNNKRLVGSGDFGILNISDYIRTREACAYSALYLISPPCDDPLPLPHGGKRKPEELDEESLWAKQAFYIGFIWGFSLSFGLACSYICGSKKARVLLLPPLEVESYLRIYGAYISPHYDKVIEFSKSIYHGPHKVSTSKSEQVQLGLHMHVPEIGEETNYMYAFPEPFEIIPLGLD